MPELKTLREIDALVAEKVMGLPIVWGPPPYINVQNMNDKRDYPWLKGIANGVHYDWAFPEEYTKKIAAAWQVVEKMRHPLVWKDSLWNCRCWTVDELTIEVLDVQSAPLAICLAALAAHGIDVSVKEEG